MNDDLPALPGLLTDRELQSLRNLMPGLGSDAADEIVELRAAVLQRDEQIAKLTAEVEALREAVNTLEGKSTAAYAEYIAALRRDECLGWEYKVKHRKFGELELRAHTLAAEHLGMHRAFSAAAADVRAAIDAARAEAKDDHA